METGLRSREAELEASREELKNQQQHFLRDQARFESEWNSQKTELEQQRSSLQSRVVELESREHAVVQELDRIRRQETALANQDAQRRQNLELEEQRMKSREEAVTLRMDYCNHVLAELAARERLLEENDFDERTQDLERREELLQQSIREVKALEDKLQAERAEYFSNLKTNEERMTAFLRVEGSIREDMNNREKLVAQKEQELAAMEHKMTT
eukprot:g107.t1